MVKMTSDERQRYTEAVTDANIPTLLMVLLQLTGERKWLEAPYRPKPPRGMSDNDSGGLPTAVQQEIRDAAREAIIGWREGRPAAIPEPSPDLLVEMLSCAMAERIPHEYGPMIAGQLGLRPLTDGEPIEVPDGFSVLIIGAGMSGLCAAYNLKRAGIPFVVLEKSAHVAGTWAENRYPGSGVDTPTHLYSFSFATFDWSMYFALREEIHAYFEDVAGRFALRDEVQFETEVVSLAYQESEQRWAVTVRHADGSTAILHAPVVISATGIFNPIKLPLIDGLQDFDGPCVHTAQWPSDLDVTGKRVALIGNGASAMQVGPEIQHQVESLTIFQRSPHWVAPFEQFRKEIPDPVRFLMREVPLYQSWYRVRLGWTFNDRVYPALQKDPTWEYPDRSVNALNDKQREYFSNYIRAELGDRTDLLEHVLPTYPPFGKRLLMDNGWYRMLRNDKVKLVTEHITKIDANRIITADAGEYPADVLVLATGFDASRFLTSFQAYGRDGRSLREVWDDDDARAYLGLTMPGFPNFFALYGPNTQVGHGGSLVFVIEMQMRYIADLLRTMITEGIGVVECRKDIHDEYNAGVDRAHENMVWTHTGMSSYYRNTKGRVVVNYPYRNVDLFNVTERANLNDFVTEPRPAHSDHCAIHPVGAREVP
jgi:4-hydroxyacetophenone monooxygenase